MNRSRRVARHLAAATVLVVLFAFVASAQKKVPPASPIDLNTATLAQLEQLPGVGPSMAQTILNMRAKTRFQHVDDLLAIHGMSPNRLDKIRPYVFVGRPPAAK
jgi:competence ComEA-like helix-hairpin-helix protein